MQHNTSTTDLITRLRSGDRTAFESLYSRVYEDLRRIAHRNLQKEGAGAVLSTTALVDEAYLRFDSTKQLDLNDRSHFKAIVARVMRRVITDTARRVRAQKRGGAHARVTFEEQLHPHRPMHTMDEVLDLDLAIERLSKIDGRQADVVIFRFYADMEYEEIACALGISVPTVRRDWAAARALLTRWLQAA